MDCAFVVKWKNSRWGVHFVPHHPIQGNGGTSDIYDGAGNRYQQPIQAVSPDGIVERFKNLISERTGVNASRIVAVGFPESGRGVGEANYHVG